MQFHVLNFLPFLPVITAQKPNLPKPTQQNSWKPNASD